MKFTDFFNEFLSNYGSQILYAILTAIAGYLGIFAKKLYAEYADDQTKKSVVKTVVQAVNQLYKDLHGEDKYNKAVELASDMLAEKGVSISELEIKMLIEAAVNEFNNTITGIEVISDKTAEV